MTFTPLSPNFPLSNLDVDYESATEQGGLRAGQLAIYQRQLLRTSYLPYATITHAFLRREQVIAKMCCGAYNADQFHLVLVDADGQEHQLHLETKEDGDALLQTITQHQPGAKIGFNRQQ